MMTSKEARKAIKGMVETIDHQGGILAALRTDKHPEKSIAAYCRYVDAIRRAEARASEQLIHNIAARMMGGKRGA